MVKIVLQLLFPAFGNLLTAAGGFGALAAITGGIASLPFLQPQTAQRAVSAFQENPILKPFSDIGLGIGFTGRTLANILSGVAVDTRNLAGGTERFRGGIVAAVFEDFFKGINENIIGNVTKNIVPDVSQNFQNLLPDFSNLGGFIPQGITQGLPSFSLGTGGQGFQLPSFELPEAVIPAAQTFFPVSGDRNDLLGLLPLIGIALIGGVVLFGK